MSALWLTVAPSLTGGWGLTTIEANAMRTSAVAYNVPGLRDSVRHDVTRWLVQPKQSLAGALIGALDELSDPQRQHLTASQARAWTARFSWDSSAERLAGVLSAETRQRELGNPERQAVDLAAVASWPPDVSEELGPLLRTTLRITGIISGDDDRLKVLLIGCDDRPRLKTLTGLLMRLTAAITTSLL